MTEWNPEQYIKFEKERTQPSVDLIGRVEISPKSILDIGCGPGNSTHCLSQSFPSAKILGIDSSESMLEKAQKTYPSLDFQKCIVPDELENLEKFDLIFSNACLHWIPEHTKLLPKIVEKLNDGGVLAVQMPLVQKAEFYKKIYALAEGERWKKLKSVNIFHNLSSEEYYDILTDVGCDVTLWETAYYHRVTSHDAVIAWYKGSGLRAYLEFLEDSEKEEFLIDLSEEIKKAFTNRSDGSILLKMPRMFLTATKR